MQEFYEFFCGGGMARLGLGSNWKCALANDFDPTKAAFYKKNFGTDEIVVGDIAKISIEQLPGNPTLAWASFPCQDLSLAGKGKGLAGERSGTFWAFWKIIESLDNQQRAPKIIVLENVCGAITANNGKDFSTLLETIATRNYKFGAMVMNASLFVPQSRPRLFIVAVSPEIEIPTALTRHDPSTTWHPKSLVDAKFKQKKKIQDNWIWWNIEAPPQRDKILADLIEDKPTGVKWNSKEETDRILAMMSPLNQAKVKSAQNDGELRVGTLYKRTRNGICHAEVRFDDIAGCLRTPSGGSSRQTIVIVKGKSVKTRLLSPRESARLMGLPESYQLPQSYNDAYHLTGDGLVVPVVEYLANHLLTPLSKSCKQKKKKKAA